MNREASYSITNWVNEFVKYFKTSDEEEIKLYIKLLNIPDTADNFEIMHLIIFNMPSDYIKYIKNLYINEIVSKLIYLTGGLEPNLPMRQNDRDRLFDVVLGKSEFAGNDGYYDCIHKLNDYFKEFRDNCNNYYLYREYGYKKINCVYRLNTVMCKKLECANLCNFLSLRSINRKKYEEIFDSLIGDKLGRCELDLLLKDLKEDEKNFYFKEKKVNGN